MKKIIKPRDIDLPKGIKRIWIPGWSAISQSIAWAIVAACWQSNAWKALSLQDISKHADDLRAQIIVGMVDSFFQREEYLDLVSYRYIPTQKFINACFETQPVKK